MFTACAADVIKRNQRIFSIPASFWFTLNHHYAEYQILAFYVVDVKHSMNESRHGVSGR